MTRVPPLCAPRPGPRARRAGPAPPATPGKASRWRPGWRSLSYEAPAAGSYALPPIMDAADGEVLLECGEPARLHDLFGDRLVLFSFIYTRCSDLNGCPLANAVLHKLQARLRARPELARATRLLSMSFDPARDTPETMRAFGPRPRRRAASTGGS